ncbi:hypothetical protein [Chitinophaga caseinilytica]|uniref:Tetratricopeptide repeat protein n=1 Tax=Chitinophaga caseinilytica TaxID=2267521 RepID=A0ABZ2Z0B8_9BACT
MKKITTIVIALFVVFAASAQSPQLEGAVSKLNSARTAADFQDLANTFQRLASADAKSWLPPYYAAVANMKLAFLQKEKAMALSALAEEQIAKAEALVPAGNAKEMSEIYTVKSFIERSKVEADPMTNGRKFGPIAGKYLAQARKLDPQNPRALYLDGHIKFHTPALWGGDKDKAKALFTEALRHFNEPPASATAPQWGKTECQQMLQ